MPGKVPLWLEGGELEIGQETESTVGAVLTAGTRRIVYVPGCAALSDAILLRIEGADMLLFDGTVLA